MNNIVNKFTTLPQRDLENRYYDYLILDIDNKKEIQATVNFIIQNKINIELYFFINARFKKKRLYIQISDLKENKNLVTNNLKKIHNFFRIKYNKNISFKKSSKHSVFFEARNFLINLNLKKGSVRQSQLGSYGDEGRHGDLPILQFAFLAFKDDLNLIYEIEIQDEYKKL